MKIYFLDETSRDDDKSAIKKMFYKKNNADHTLWTHDHITTIIKTLVIHDWLHDLDVA